MKHLRIIFLIAICITGTWIIVALYNKKLDTPLGSTFVPFFQLIGEPVRAVDVIATKVMPLNDLDEKEYGDYLAERYKNFTDTTDARYKYLNELIRTITQFSKKPFNYHVFIVNNSIPNACAFPGGVILVTNGLFDVILNEGQLVSILAHEMGHIELEHCLKLAKFQLLSEKINLHSVFQIADFLNDLFLRHAYNKTEEAEADAFAYNLVLKTNYSPSSLADAFIAFQLFRKKEGYNDSNVQSANLIRDYFLSHPLLTLRIAKYKAEAEAWWAINAGVKKYLGAKNLKMNLTLYQRFWNDEWTDTNH